LLNLPLSGISAILHSFSPSDNTFQAMSLIQKFQQTMSTHGSGVAFIQGGKTIRRQVFVQMVASFAKAMVDLGLKQGQVVGVSMPQTAEHLAVLLALARIGAVSLPIHPMSSGDAKRQLMKRFSATALVTLKAPDPLPPNLGFEILTLQQLQIAAPDNGLQALPVLL
jgi:acyl-CoA synthetase (AMP-forming)/AMP-acid ligase II